MKYRKAWLTHVVEVNPLNLSAKLVHESGRDLVIHTFNFVNGIFFGEHNGAVVPCGWIVSKGQILSKRLDHDKIKRGTFIIYKNGSVKVRMIKDLDKEDDITKIWFAVQGFNMFPLNLEAEWYNPAEVGYKTWRPVIGYNPDKEKVIIAVRPSSTAQRGRQTLIALGCDRGIGLDAGGSTNLNVNGRPKVLTDRVLNNIIIFG